MQTLLVKVFSKVSQVFLLEERYCKIGDNIYIDFISLSWFDFLFSFCGRFILVRWKTNLFTSAVSGKTEILREMTGSTLFVQQAPQVVQLSPG